MRGQRPGFVVGLALWASTGWVQAAEVVKYYHSDSIGTVRAVTDRDGNVLERFEYYPFGEDVTAPSTPTHRRFTGKERDDESGLDYFGARHYLARTARFTSVDPVYTWSENLSNPQLWNRYAYARNNPLRYVDPDGRCSAPAGIGSGVGFCVESFIASSSIGGIGLGDNRGFDAHAGLSARAQIRFIVDPSTGAVSDFSALAGVSEVGIPGFGGAGIQGRVHPTIRESGPNEDGVSTVALSYKATNGFGEGLFDTIDVHVNFLIDRNGNVSIGAGSVRDGFPSLGAYSYRNVQGTDVVSMRREIGERTPGDLAAPMEETIPPGN